MIVSHWRQEMVCAVPSMSYREIIRRYLLLSFISFDPLLGVSRAACGKEKLIENSVLVQCGGDLSM